MGGAAGRLGPYHRKRPDVNAGAVVVSASPSRRTPPCCGSRHWPMAIRPASASTSRPRSWHGDNVNFSINRGPDGNNSCDATGFDPTIVFTPPPIRSGPERGEPDPSGGHHRTRQRGPHGGHGEHCVEHDGAGRLGHQSKSGGRHAGGARQCRRTRRVVRPAITAAHAERVDTEQHSGRWLRLYPHRDGFELRQWRDRALEWQ